MKKIDILGKTIGQIYVKECLGGKPLKYLCVCPCGDSFEASSRSIRNKKIDCGCGIVSGIHNKPFNIEDIYQGSTIIDVSKKYNNQTCYTFTCAKCGEKSVRIHSDFIKRPICQDCAKKEADTQREEQIRTEFVGKTIKGIKILGISNQGGGATRADALCPICGKQFTTLLSRIKLGIGSCEKCAEKNLEVGHEIVKNAAIDGTSVLCIKPDRALNSNNATGYKGVSKYANGKYRAYINFKRKQYHLGLYDSLKDAIAARKVAEEKIYGDFLKWYAEEFPEQWARMKH